MLGNSECKIPCNIAWNQPKNGRFSGNPQLQASPTFSSNPSLRFRVIQLLSLCFKLAPVYEKHTVFEKVQSLWKTESSLVNVSHFGKFRNLFIEVHPSCSLYPLTKHSNPDSFRLLVDLLFHMHSGALLFSKRKCCRIIYGNSYMNMCKKTLQPRRRCENCSYMVLLDILWLVEDVR